MDETDNTHAVTIKMKINYLKTVCSGKVVLKPETFMKARIFVSDVEVKNEGKLVAKNLIY